MTYPVDASCPSECCGRCESKHTGLKRGVPPAEAGDEAMAPGCALLQERAERWVRGCQAITAACS